MANKSETEKKIEEIRNNPYESGRILCADQNTCKVYEPWEGCDFCGPRIDDDTRKRIRCEFLSDLRGLDITIANHRKTMWGCGNVFNLKPGGGHKRVGIVIKPDKEK